MTSSRQATNSGPPAAITSAVTSLVVIVGLFWLVNHNSHSPTSVYDNSAASSTMAKYVQKARQLTEDMESGGTHCRPSDFKLSDLRGTEEYGYITITGVVRNNCSEAAAPQLKISIYTGSGHLLDTQEPWPASVSNIAPHSSYEWKAMMPAAGGWKRYSVGVLTVRAW